jgi:short subunit dehydrogenase-like uncharacterized protein
MRGSVAVVVDTGGRLAADRRVTQRQLDLVVYGATGFSGRQAARYLDRRAPRGLRWAIAGRSREKLEAIQRTLTDPTVSLIVADAAQPASLAAMVRQTRAIVSTVGPFRRYGTPLVEACVAEGTHYADITGETTWVRSLLGPLEADAKARGVKLVPFSGYDSMPSDLGTYALVKHVRDTRGVGLRKVEAFHFAKGGFNGGTLATMLDLSVSGRDGFREPWLLSPGFAPTEAARALDRDPRQVRFHDGAGLWTAPFVMGAINTRVVRRSVMLAAEAGAPYGRDFAFQEYWGSRARTHALGMLAMAGAADFAMRSSVGRSLVERFGPQPGEGPSEAAMDGGFFTCRYVGETEDGQQVTARMKGSGDPGNRSTVRFLIEAGLLLAGDDLPPGGGVLTPSTAFGLRLLERAAPHGLEFSVGA